MANPVGKIVFKVVSIGVGVPVGIATRKGVEKVWLAARPGDPPRRPTDPYVSWGDALGWAALSAAGMAVAELVKIKGSTSLYRTLTGGRPPARKQKGAAKQLKAIEQLKAIDAARAAPAVG
jgi:Protein of unknown function (DUF4235)